MHEKMSVQDSKGFGCEVVVPKPLLTAGVEPPGSRNYNILNIAYVIIAVKCGKISKILKS